MFPSHDSAAEEGSSVEDAHERDAEAIPGGDGPDRSSVSEVLQKAERLSAEFREHVLKEKKACGHGGAFVCFVLRDVRDRAAIHDAVDVFADSVCDESLFNGVVQFHGC